MNEESYLNLFEQSDELDAYSDVEEEHELLNAALFALTTHFAQVQFRLHQILNVKPEERDILLKSLERFAEKGIPDLTLFREKNDTTVLYKSLQRTRRIQKHLIQTLNVMLDELKNCTSSIENEYQMDQELIEIKSKLNNEYLKYIAANKMWEFYRNDNERFIAQLKQQLEDLECFIKLKTKQQTTCVCQKINNRMNNSTQQHNLYKEICFIVNFLATIQMKFIMHIFNFNNQSNMIKSRHYGELRAKLEISIFNVINTYKNDNLLYKVLLENFVPDLQKLMEHGTKQQFTHNFPWFLCFLNKNSNTKNYKCHIWCIILEYFYLYSLTSKKPNISRKLARSFDLDIHGSLSLSDKESVLYTIAQINSTHEKFKQSYDIQFRAFVCAALNAKKLVVWLKLIFQDKQIVKKFYYTWSYVAKTQIEDCAASLEFLNNYSFHLQVNYAISDLENINDAFYVLR